MKRRVRRRRRLFASCGRRSECSARAGRPLTRLKSRECENRRLRGLFHRIPGRRGPQVGATAPSRSWLWSRTGVPRLTLIALDGCRRKCRTAHAPSHAVSPIWRPRRLDTTLASFDRAVPSTCDVAIYPPKGLTCTQRVVLRPLVAGAGIPDCRPFHSSACAGRAGAILGKVTLPPRGSRYDLPLRRSPAWNLNMPVGSKANGARACGTVAVELI